ncbi:MAG: dTDP-glucose 4,6-dehydratase [bacterium]|nr:dTDP-glucose 4,6-dehydratase [bacterium]
MKLLVTGGAGFIGSNFIQYWIDKYPEDEIINLDKLTYAGNLDNLKSIESNKNYTFVQGDICDVNLVDKILKDIDTIVHFAADSHVDRSISDPDPFIKTNIEGTYVLLKMALKNKIKHFHHISTDEVFGSLELGTKEKFNENTKYNPNSPYSASKAGSDHLVNAFFSTYDLPITISNCSNNFGPYQFPEKLIPLTITNLIQNKNVPIYGDGLNVRDWLYVKDHCSAIDLILNKGKIGETYVIGGMTKDISNLDIVKKIIKLMDKGEEMIEYVEDRLGHDRRYSVEWSKINKELGWEPSRNFEDNLESTVNWYKQNETWWRRILSGEYKK